MRSSIRVQVHIDEEIDCLCLHSIMMLPLDVFTIVLTWTPTDNQYGPQGFCAGAIDNTGVQSDPWCITFLVGFTPPNLQQPWFVQHSASPLGTVFANHTIFSIQSRFRSLYLNADGSSARCEWRWGQSTWSKWNIHSFQ